MKLQLLIPQYRETEAVIKPLLDSVAMQQNVPFDELGAVIVNDGSDTLLDEAFLAGYPFEIEYYKEPHRGVSAARNACLDRAKAEYVMFCDADDMFYNACGLWFVFREMAAGFDSLVSVFTEETRGPDGREVVYINRERDCTFVHGKVHRRQYLIEKGIRWNEALTVHEDSYFNILCQSLSGNVKYCVTPFYLWRWRDDSVCRHDPKYMLRTYRNMLDSNEALVGELTRRGEGGRARQYAAAMIFDAYYTMNKPEWVNQENVAYRDATERRFAAYFRRMRALWDETPIEEKMNISNGVRARSVMEGMRMESVTIDGWLGHIAALEEEENEG